ncbi:hypothetical protein HBH46_166840 [Parastagonospora nodorum]|nr:hypothetical protein HBH46_166840 [Parastagonospora nodorum]KAH5107993.1 hypothetical protein HBH72_042160 [Parastagonospora nodorum]KAH5387870.1 hypothetical protein HBI33_055680 [Parastagonospora nodorum]KAH5433522.1 hypothetical protein HBI47_086740 [Parastagonospora nodorum]
MHLNFLFVAAALVQSSLQAPPPPNQKPDACAKAISSGPPKPPRGTARTDVAKADCSSFLSQIVVPCAVTSTTVLTSTKTAKGSTRTSTQSITVTATAIVTKVATVDRSVVSTNQQTQLTTLIVPQNSTAFATEIATTTSTVFETVLLTNTYSTAVVTSTVGTPSLQRRDTSISVLPDRPHHTTLPSNATLNARQNNGKCNPSIFTPDNVPDYASPCRDLKSYSIACQKLGVTGKTMTLPASISYTTRTTTTTTTPTIVVNITKTFQATTTKAVTSPVTRLHTAVENTTTTQTITTTSTSTLTSTVTSYITSNTTRTSTLTTSIIATSTALITPTPTPSPSSCTSDFRLSVTGTPATIGTYIRTFGASEKLGFTPNATLSSTFSLDSASRLFEPSTSLYANTDSDGLYYVYAEAAGTVESAGYLYITCEVSGEGDLECKATNGGDGFYWCPVIGPPDALVFGSEEGRVQAAGWDCVGLGVRVECI